MDRPPGTPQEPRREETTIDKSSTWAAITREFYVDFLGSLVPGLLFTLTAALPVWWAAQFVWGAILAATHAGTPAAGGTLRDVETFRIEFVSLGLVLSYVLGSVFYRRDPKVPDQRSAAYILWRDRDGIERCVIQPATQEEMNDDTNKSVDQFAKEASTLRKKIDELKKSPNISSRISRLWPRSRFWWLSREGKKLHALILEATTGEGGQFPYSHLHEYLEARGLQHLADIVTWRGNSIGSHRLRTKMFINLLKVRVQYQAPNKCSEIVRNEAHVRMMSSVWYAAQAMKWLCGTLAVLVSLFAIRSGRSADLWGILLFVVLLFAAALLLQLTIRRFFHYQRVREIVYVLETAYWAKQSHSSILDNLSEQPNPDRPQMAAEGAVN
jgi:hypothetical protein